MAIKNLGAKRLQGLKLDRVSDSLGSSADGANTDVTLDTTNKKLGTGCYDYDGESGTVTVLGSTGTFDFMHMSSAWSMAFWLNIDEAIEQQVFNQQTSSTTNSFDFIIIDSTQARFRCLSSSDIYTSGITAGNWHHLAFTFDGSNIRAYTDGVLKNTLSHTAGGSTGSLAIDIAQNNFASSHGEFLMDDCGFWERTLTATEIQALVNNNAPIVYDNTGNQNGDGIIATGYQIRYGQEISADNEKIGDSVNKMTIKAKRFGSPDGVLQCRIYSGSVGSSSKTLVATSTTTLACSAVSTSAQTEYSFDFASPRTVAAGDCYVLELTTNTSTSFSNRIGVGYYNSTIADTTIVTSTVSSSSTFTFNSPSGYSMSHKLYNGGGGTYVPQLVSSISKENLKAYYSFDQLGELVYNYTDAPSTSDRLSPSTDSSVTNMYGISRVAVKVDGSTYAGKTITSATWKLMKVGTLTGTCYCKIHDSSDNHVATATTTYNNSTLSSSAYEELTFYFSSPVTLADGYRIFVEYATDDGSGNYVKLGDKHTGNNIVPAGWRYNIYDTANGWNTGQGADYSQKLAPWAKIDQFGCKNNASTTSDLDALTGVRTNTIFEQTDDIPAYYWRQTLDGTTAWFPTFAGNFVAGDWTAVGGGTASTNEVTLALDTDGNQDTLNYDLGSISSDKWVLDFTLNFSRLTIGTNIFWFMGLVNSTNWVATNNTNHMGMFVMQESGTKQFACSDGTGTWNGASEDAQTWTPSTSTDYYFRITKLSSTTYKTELFSDSARTSVTSTSDGAVSAMTDLQYLTFAGDNNSGNGNATFTVSDIKFFNGVSSV